jgi:methionine-rich copper-binding protein CopC
MKTFATAAAGVLAGAALLAAAGAASAHAKLVSSSPAQNAVGAAPKQIVLKFSEKLQPKFSGVAVTMPQMNDMAVAARTGVAKDGVTLVVTPAKPLMPGAYAVKWHAVTADTHRMEGQFSFTVR